MKPDSQGLAPSPHFVAQALGLQLPGAQDEKPFALITSDSRKVVAGCLFVAIPGEKFDGHDFIAEAASKGARGVICRRGTSAPPSLRAFAVDDTITAYRRLAQAWRKRFAISVVAVAGSVGKTTTKELLAAILEGKWPGQVLKTQGSQNGFVGIPMTLLELRSIHQAAVIEVGIDEIGAMEKHIPLVHPSAAVITAIGPEHLEKLLDVPTVAREEGLALSLTVRTGGIAAICLDDPWIKPYATILRTGRRIGYTLRGEKVNLGPRPAPPLELLDGVLSDAGAEFKLTLRGLGLDGLELLSPLPGEHNAANLMAAVAVAAGLGLTRDEIKRGLALFKGAEGRSELRKTSNGTPVVCDYYNANPTSVEAALALLTRVAAAGLDRKRWACLGDMLELGPDEETFHRALARPLLKHGVEHILLYGSRMKWLEAELIAQKFTGTLAWFESHAELARALKSGLAAPTPAAVLIKGSRGTRMEEVWKLLAS